VIFVYLQKHKRNEISKYNCVVILFERKKVPLRGLQLHMTSRLAPENHGYEIKRVDLPHQLVRYAIAENVTNTQRGTLCKWHRQLPDRGGWIWISNFGVKCHEIYTTDKSDGIIDIKDAMYAGRFVRDSKKAHNLIPIQTW